MRGAYRVLVGKHEKKRHLKNLIVDVRIMLKCIFKKWGHGLDLSGCGLEQVAGSCECGNEPSVP